MTEAAGSGEVLDRERVDAIYAAPLAEFIEMRNALAAELKSAGDKQGAALARKLAKPNLVAWVCNQLFYRHRQELDVLIDAGELLRGAQQSGQAVALREAAEDRRAAIGALMRIVDGVLEHGGHASTLATLKKIERTLEAIAVYGRTGLVEPAPGRLVKELEPPGFEVLATLASVPTVPVDRRETKRKESKRKESKQKESKQNKGAQEAAKDTAAPGSSPPKLAVMRGGKSSRENRAPTPRPGSGTEHEKQSAPPAVDAGRLRQRNRLLRRVKELTTLADKSKIAIARSELTMKDSERAFDRRQRNFEAARKALEEATAELDERRSRVAELELQHRTLVAKLEDVEAELAELEGTIALERETR